MKFGRVRVAHRFSFLYCVLCLFVFVLCLVCPKLPVSGLSMLSAPAVFSIMYFRKVTIYLDI
jgi:hypothetical protein